MQADTTLMLREPIRDVDPHTGHYPISTSIQHFHHHLRDWAKQPTEKNIFALVDRHVALEMKEPLQPLEMTSPATHFETEK